MPPYNTVHYFPRFLQSEVLGANRRSAVFDAAGQLVAAAGHVTQGDMLTSRQFFPFALQQVALAAMRCILSTRCSASY